MLFLIKTQLGRLSMTDSEHQLEAEHWPGFGVGECPVATGISYKVHHSTKRCLGSERTYLQISQRYLRLSDRSTFLCLSLIVSHNLENISRCEMQGHELWVNLGF